MDVEQTSILVVEDEILVAIEIEEVIREMGHRPIGIAPDMARAFDLADDAEIALVDLNLRDGPTGAEIGRRLASEFGVTVIFMTANPSQLGNGVDKALGVISKPVSDRELREAIEFAAQVRANRAVASPPQRLRLFNQSSAA